MRLRPAEEGASLFILSPMVGWLKLPGAVLVLSSASTLCVCGKIYKTKIYHLNHLKA